LILPLGNSVCDDPAREQGVALGGDLGGQREGLVHFEELRFLVAEAELLAERGEGAEGAAGAATRSAGRRRGDRQGDVDPARLRRVADADVGAALRLEVECQRVAHSAALVGHPDRDVATVDRHAAEELVVLDLGRHRHRRLAQGDAIRRTDEAELVAVEVVTVGDAPGHLQGVHGRARRDLVGLGGVEQLRFAALEEGGRTDGEARPQEQAADQAMDDRYHSVSPSARSSHAR
jgi:hypothetical protein